MGIAQQKYIHISEDLVDISRREVGNMFSQNSSEATQNGQEWNVWFFCRSCMVLNLVPGKRESIAPWSLLLIDAKDLWTYNKKAHQRPQWDGNINICQQSGAIHIKDSAGKQWGLLIASVWEQKMHEVINPLEPKVNKKLVLCSIIWTNKHLSHL